MSFIAELFTSVKQHERERDKYQWSSNSVDEKRQERNRADILNKIDYGLTTCATTVACIDDSANANSDAVNRLFGSLRKFLMKWNLIKGQNVLRTDKIDDEYNIFESHSENERKLRWYERHGLPGGAHGLRRIFGLLNTKQHQQKNEDKLEAHNTKGDEVNFSHKLYDAAHLLTPESTLASEEMVKHINEHEKEVTSKHNMIDKIETKAKPFTLLAELISSWTRSSDTMIEQRSTSLRPTVMVTNAEESDNINNNHNYNKDVHHKRQDEIVNKEIHQRQSSLSLYEMEQSKKHKANNAQLSTVTSNTLLRTTNSSEKPLVMTHKSLQNHISYLVHSTHDIRSEEVALATVNVNSEQLIRYHTHACLSLFDKVEAKESDQWNAENSAFEMHDRVIYKNDTTRIDNIEKNKENKYDGNTITTLHTNEHHNCSCYRTWPDDELHSISEENSDEHKMESEEQKGEMHKSDAHLDKGMKTHRKITTPSVRSDLTSSSCLTRTTSSYINTYTSQTSTNIYTNASSQCSNASLQSEVEEEEYEQEQEEECINGTVKDKTTQSRISTGAAEHTSTEYAEKKLQEKEEEKLSIKEITAINTGDVVEEQTCCHDVLETMKEETNVTGTSNKSTESSVDVPSSSSPRSSVASSSDRSLIKYTNPTNYQNSLYKRRKQQEHNRKCHNKLKLTEDNNIDIECNYNNVTKDNASHKKQTQGIEKQERQCVKVRDSGSTIINNNNNTTMVHRKLTIAQLWRILETRRELQHLHSEALLHNRLLRPTRQPGQVEMQHHCVKDNNTDSKVCLLENAENMETECKHPEKAKNAHKLMIKQTKISNNNKENNDVEVNITDANRDINNKEMVSSVTSPSSYSSSPLSVCATHNNQVSVHSPVTFTHNPLPSLSETLSSNFPDPALIAACYRNLHRDYNAYGNVLSDLTHSVIQLESFGIHEFMPHERMNANALTEVNGNALRFHSLIEMRNYESSQIAPRPEQQKEEIKEHVDRSKITSESQEDHHELESNSEEKREITNVQANSFTSALSPYTGHSLSVLSPSSLNNNGNVTSATFNVPEPSPSIKERSSTYSSSVTSHYTSSESSSSSTSTVSQSCSSSVRDSKLDFTQELLHERRRDDLRVKNYDGSAQYAISLTYHNSITGTSKTIDTNVLPPLSLSGSGPFACAPSQKCNNNSSNKKIHHTSTFTKTHPPTCHHSCPLTWQSPLFVEHQNSTRSNNNNNNIQRLQKNKYDTTRATREPCKTLSNLSVPMTRIKDQYIYNNNIKNKNTRNKGNLSEMYSMAPTKLHRADKEPPAGSSTTFSSTRLTKNNKELEKEEEEEEEAAKRVPLFSAPLPACEPADGPRLQGVAGRRGEMRIGAFLGGGACGKVYECLNTETGEILAAKQIVFDEKDPQLRQRLKQLELELEVLTISARHQCKWIVGFHGAEKRGHSVLMYLEYCEYSSLLDYLTNGNSHDAPVWGGARSVPADPPPSICLYGETARRVAEERQSNLHRLHPSRNNNVDDNNDNKLYNTVIVQAHGLHESNSLPLIKPLKCLTEQVRYESGVTNNDNKLKMISNNYTTTKIKATGFDNITTTNDKNKKNIFFTDTNTQDRHHQHYNLFNNRFANCNPNTANNNHNKYSNGCGNNSSETIPNDGLSTSLMVHLVHSNTVVANARGVNGLSCFDGGGDNSFSGNTINNVDCSEGNTNVAEMQKHEQHMESSTTLTNTWDSTLFTSTSLPAPFTQYVPESMKWQQNPQPSNVKNAAENTITNDEMELSLMGIYNKEQLQEQHRRRREKEQRAHERHHYKNYLTKHTHNNNNSENNYSADECKQINTAHSTEKEEKCVTQETNKENVNDAERNKCEEMEIKCINDDNNMYYTNVNETHINATHPTPTSTPTIATMTLSEALHPQVAPLSIHQVQRFAQQIVNGLLFLHTHGYAHLDVKTANVLVTSNEECRLADLGCAMRLQPTPTHQNNTIRVNSSEAHPPQEELLEHNTESLLSEKEEEKETNHDEEVKSNAHRYRVLLDHDGITELRGTALYMAPEMIRFERLNIGSAADIWSLGCVMMEMATGQAPWRHIATDKLKVLFRVGSARTELPLPPLLRAWNEEAEEWLEAHHQEMETCQDHFHRIQEQEKYLHYYEDQVNNAEQKEEEVEDDDHDVEEELEEEYGESSSHKRYSLSHPRHRRRRLENKLTFVEEEKKEENEHDEIECKPENSKSSCPSSRNVTTINNNKKTDISEITHEKETNENLCNYTCKDVLQGENSHASHKKTLHYNSSLEVLEQEEEEEESIQELSANSSNETLSHVSNETAIYYNTPSNHRHICTSDSEGNIKNENSNTNRSHKPTYHATSLATSVNNGRGYIPITPGSEEANFNAAHSASYPPGSMTDINRKTRHDSCVSDYSNKIIVEESQLAHEHHRHQRLKRQRSHGNNNNNLNHRQSSHTNNTNNTSYTHLLAMSSDYLSYQHRLMTMYVALTDFIECCLRIAPDERWTIEELAEHPFLHM